MPEPRASAEPPDLTALAGLKLGNYRLERLVGRGRMGVVYVAKDEALLRPTAIKVLSWSVAEARGHDPVQWFLAEARLVARINHPRVVQIYGAARHGDYCYIAMEYVPGRSAEAMVARGAPIPAALATDIVVQAASALHAAHGAGVVHRDVKPANLLVGDGGVTKLGDFGMALGPPEVGTGTARLRVGTPYYTAPEVWRGEPATPASDVYSLGATYYHLLTGRPPYPDAEIAAVEQRHLRAPIPDPRALVPTLPAACSALVRRALAKGPRERHASAQELLGEARRILEELGSAAVTAPGAPPPPARAHEPAPPPAPLLAALGFVRRPFAGAGPAAAPRLVAALGDAAARVPDREALRAHLRAWLEATLSRSAPPVLVTPDALLLLELRSGGALERVDCLAENMLLLAAAEGRRVLSSWHAWAASDRERWAEGAPALPRRPAGWPPPEVVDVIDACRRAAGVPPWPRAAPERG